MTVQETRLEYNRRLGLNLKVQPNPSMSFPEWWSQNKENLGLFPESPHTFQGLFNKTRNYQLGVSYRWLWRELSGQQMPSQKTINSWRSTCR